MIPKRYKLLGQTIKVRVIPTAKWRSKDCVGLYEPTKQLISIHGALEPQQRQQTFVHELVHSILSAMEHRMNDDEKAVDLFASLLHQAWTTIDEPEAKPRRKRSKGD